jgi:hypothetical protein
MTHLCLPEQQQQRLKYIYNTYKNVILQAPVSSLSGSDLEDTVSQENVFIPWSCCVCTQCHSTCDKLVYEGTDHYNWWEETLWLHFETIMVYSYLYINII